MAEIVQSLDLRQWRDALQKMSRSAQGAASILKAVVNTLGFKDIDQHFREERGPEGPWPRRAASTQAMYAAIASGRRRPPRGASRAQFSPTNKILQMTGDLRKSIGPTNVKNVTKNSIMIFSNIKYSGKHQEGDAGKGLPARPFLWFGKEPLAEMAEAAASLWLRGGAGAV